MSRFTDALDRNLEDIKRPPPLPMGNYIFQVTKMPDPAEPVEGKPYEILRIPVKVVSALEDVDPDELAVYGNVIGTANRVSFIFNTDPDESTKFEGTLNRLKSFLGHCGIEGGSLKEGLSQLPNARFVGTVIHRVDERDGESVFAEIDRTAPVA